jgi:hypothetical protein
VYASTLLALMLSLWLAPAPVPRAGILPGEVPEDVGRNPKPTKPPETR